MSLRKAVYVIAAVKDLATERKIVVLLVILPVCVGTIQRGRQSNEPTTMVTGVFGEWGPPKTFFFDVGVGIGQVLSERLLKRVST